MENKLSQAAIQRAIQNKLQSVALNVPNEKCFNCGWEWFEQFLQIRKVSRLEAGTPNDVLVTIPILACAHCSKPFTGEEADGKEENNDARREGPKGGNGSSDEDGGIIIPGS